MSKIIIRYFWSVLCFCFFMVLATGSGCNGCQSSSVTQTNNEESDTDGPVFEPEVVEEEKPEIKDNINDFTTDVVEDEREAEETFQTETEEEVVEAEEIEETPADPADPTDPVAPSEE